MWVGRKNEVFFSKFLSFGYRKENIKVSLKRFKVLTQSSVKKMYPNTVTGGQLKYVYLIE